MSEAGDRLLGPTTVPRWSYAAAKAVDEHLAFAYAANGLRVSVVRYFNCYGPGMDMAGDASVVAVFLRHALAGEPIPVHGDGRQTRCFTYISDTVRGTLLAASVPQAQGQVLNIGSATETSIAALAELVATAAGSQAPAERIPYEAVYGPRFEDVRRRVPDIHRAREVLGWEPQVPLPEGLKRTIAWCSRASWAEKTGGRA
jgi:UDP-glucose 4-epimerase